MHPSPTSPTRVGPDDFRHLMAGFPTGVSVVTTIDDNGIPRGMTCSSLCGVSLDPPTILVCLRTGSPTLAAVLARSSFAVNLLHAGAEPVADLFASADPRRFALVAWRSEPGSGNPHLAASAHTTADCRVTTHHEVGDHTVLFGEVTRMTARDVRNPLLHGLRTYRAWTDAPSVRADTTISLR